MSKTIRNVAYSNTCARGIRYRQQYKNTVRWVEEMKDAGYEPRNRDKAIAQQNHLNAWDDYSVSGWHEMSYLFKLIDNELGDLPIGFCRWRQWEQIAARLIQRKRRKYSEDCRQRVSKC